MELYLHIGLQKTGSTFLQKEVFPNLKGVTFIRNLFDYDKIYKSENVRSIGFEEKVLFSYENFSGIPYGNVDKVNRFGIVNNLYKLFPDAKIILFIRERDSWIRSMYKEMVMQGLSISFEKFEVDIDYTYLLFDYFVAYLKSLFDNVLVVDYRKFKNNNSYGIKKICDFIGCEYPRYNEVVIRKSLSDKQINTLRYFNILFKCPYNKNGFVSRNLFTKFLKKIYGY